MDSNPCILNFFVFSPFFGLYFERLVQGTGRKQRESERGMCHTGNGLTCTQTEAPAVAFGICVAYSTGGALTAPNCPSCMSLSMQVQH